MSNRFLILEDDIFIGQSMKLSLEDKGHHVDLIDNELSFWKCFQSNAYDMLLLDVDIDGYQLGIQIAQKINRSETKVPFMFITSFSDSETVDKIEATKPSGYLVKPFKNEEFLLNVSIAIQRANFPTTKIEGEIFIKSNQILVKIKLKDILYIKAYDNYCKIYTHSERFVIRKSLKEAFGGLPDGSFIQVHRSYLINFNEIEGIGNNFILIANTKIPVNKSAKDKLCRLIDVF